MALPDDVLAAVFRRLAPRCVCKAWRDVIDARRLLRADLLPHAVRGIFVEYQLLDYPAFLARPSTGAAIADGLDYLLDRPRSGFATVLDQCNGLLLYLDKGGLHVINPATQRGACLPPSPCVGVVLNHIAHLVFDPSESPHYEVFLVPDNPNREEQVNRRQVNHAPSATIVSGQTPLLSAAEDREEHDGSLPPDRSIEWPASTWLLCVFSSRTGCWEERAFSREGNAVGMVADMPSREYSSWRGYAVYWRRALYVHCNEGQSIMRISLSNDKYRVIEMPSDIGTEHSDFSLGRSEEGLSFASFHNWYNLWVWVLDESCDQIEWVLRHQIDMKPILCVLDYGEQTEGPWILQDVSNDEDDSNPAVKENNFD